MRGKHRTSSGLGASGEEPLYVTTDQSYMARVASGHEKKQKTTQSVHSEVISCTPEQWPSSTAACAYPCTTFYNCSKPALPVPGRARAIKYEGRLPRPHEFCSKFPRGSFSSVLRHTVVLTTLKRTADAPHERHSRRRITLLAHFCCAIPDTCIQLEN